MTLSVSAILFFGTAIWLIHKFWQLRNKNKKPRWRKTIFAIMIVSGLYTVLGLLLLLI